MRGTGGEHIARGVQGVLNSHPVPLSVTLTVGTGCERTGGRAGRDRGRAAAVGVRLPRWHAHLGGRRQLGRYCHFD